MKRFFHKIKASLVAFWIALISFPLKVKWLDGWIQDVQVQLLYAAPQPEPTQWEKLTMIIKTFSIPIIFIFWIIFWIISFVKIRKIDDKTLRKKKIKNTVIIISILILLIILLIFTPSIIEYFS